MKNRYILCAAALLGGAACADQPTAPRVSTPDSPRPVKSVYQVSVSDPAFGAVANDGLSDRQAFQAAVNTAQVVHVPAGTYHFEGPVVLPSDTRLYGTGAASVLTATGTSTSAILFAHTAETANSNTDVVVEHLAFQRGTGAAAFAFHTRFGQRIRLSDAWVTEMGIAKLDNSTYVEILRSRGAGGSVRPLQAIDIDHSRHVTVRHDTISNYQHGIQWWGGFAAPSDSRYQAGVFGTGNVLIEYNRIFNVDGGGIWGGMGEHITVRGNHVEYCRDVCLDAEGGTDILFEQNTAKHAGTTALAVYHGATDVRFVGNHVEQKGYDADYGDPLPCMTWPVGRVMFAMLRDCNLLYEPNEQVVTLDGNTFVYTGPVNPANPAVAVGELRKYSSKWTGVIRNQMTNTVVDMAGNNNGSVDVSENTLSFTRSTGGRPAVFVGSTHRGGTYSPGEAVVMNNTVTSSVAQGSGAAIKVWQWAWAPWIIGNTIRNNVLTNSGFAWNVEFQNDNAAHQWYINNNGGRILQTGNTAPYLIAPAN